MNKKNKTILFILTSFFFATLQAGWADQQLKKMSLKDKIAQLFMVDLRPQIEEEHERLKNYFHVDILADNKKDYIEIVKQLIKDHHIGGLIVMRGTAQEQVKLVNTFQQQSSIPLLITQDAEWGPAMRIVDAEAFPFNMTLGALPEMYNSEIEQLGFIIGKQLKQLGVQVNFGPVADINNNPNNPIIKYRSFGENKERVAQKAVAYMKGLHKADIWACGKHYPGHGNVDVDSHTELPEINSTLEELHRTELYPFKHLIDNGVDAIMTAHLRIPTIEKGVSSTLSHATITQLLKKDLDFKGLIFADCMMMNAIADHFSSGEAALKALMAGVDVILMSPNTVEAIEYIETKAKKEKNLLKRIDESCLKILKAKEKFGFEKKPPSLREIKGTDLTTEKTKKLQQQLYDHSITLVKNEDKILPLKNSFALVEIGKKEIQNRTFYKTIKDKVLKRFFISHTTHTSEQDNLIKQLESYNTIVIDLYDLSQRPQDNFGITKEIQSLLNRLSKRDKKVLLTIFGNPYSLKFFEKQNAILVAYQDNNYSQLSAAKALLGKIKTVGKLPVTASIEFYEKLGL